MALKYVDRVYYQGKVCSYFKKNNTILRYKLLKIEKRYLTAKTYRVKDTYPLQDYNVVNSQIDELESRVDDAVGRILFENPKSRITSSAIDEFFEKEKNAIELKNEDEANKHLLTDFRRFNKQKMEEKHQEDIDNGETRKLHPTMKDYISAANAIEDFEYDTKQQLYLNDIDDTFVEEFVDWLAEEHVSTEEHKYKCRGDMVNKTINKRLENLSAFIRAYYKDEEKADMIMDGRLNNKSINKVIALDLDEVKELYYRDLKNPSYNKVRDYFVFLCLTGLRFHDLTLLSAMNFLKKRNGVCSISYISHKTKVEVEFDLPSKAQAIALKYNFEFKDYTNQGFNRALGEMLETENLYEDEISVNRYILKKTIHKKVMRREKVTAHTARRTFISCLISAGVPPYQVMNMSGHVRFSTMEIYVRIFSKDVSEASKRLEF